MQSLARIERDILNAIQAPGPRPSFRDLLSRRQWDAERIIEAIDRLMYVGLIWAVPGEGITFAAIPAAQHRIRTRDIAPPEVIPTHRQLKAAVASAIRRAYRGEVR